MKVLFFINIKKKNAKNTAEKAGQILTSAGVECFMGKKYARFFENGCFQWLENDQKGQFEFFISIGGDGTIMEVAKEAVAWNKPLLGINAGRLGFMAGLEAVELERLPNLLKGRYEEQNRMLLEVHHSSLRESFLAVNDAVITKPILNNVIDVSIECNKKRVIEYRADSVLFSTPTGSTAYALSNGGPIADPTLEFISMSPICPHSLLSRTYIFEPQKQLSVHLGKGGLPTAHLLVDGRIAANLDSLDKITISKSEKTLRLIMLHQRGFYQVVGQKFIKDM